MANNDIFQNELKNLDQESAFEFYLGSYFKDRGPRPKTNISNPLIDRQQKTPSFNYYQTDSGNWRYNDFSTGDQGEIIDLIKKLYNLDFKEAVERIQSDFNIGPRPQEKDYSIDKEEWTDSNLAYWKAYWVTIDVLKKYNVYPVHSIVKNSGAKEFEIKSSLTDPIFTYQLNSNCYKIYRPLNSKYKFSWLGKKPSDYIFGFDQLPVMADKIYITGGEKDVLSLASIGCNAVCFNSETSIPSVEVIKTLKQVSKNIIVLYDNDQTGITQSKKLGEKYGLSVLKIPDDILLEGEKDISDVLKRGVDFKSFCNETTEFNVDDSILSPDESVLVNKLELTRNRLFSRLKDKINMPSPLVSLGDIGVIYPRTINIIQGKAGVHKSRLAEILCSSLITNNRQKNFLSFKRNLHSWPTVLYVDTERNLTHQFPLALQQIKIRAGFKPDEELDHFDHITLLDTPRGDRFTALNAYLKKKRTEIDGPIVVFLDVITDCIKDFNRADDSMELIDVLNSSINTHEVTFIALIHENPGAGEKARGHLGTELMNKASTVMQIGFEKDGNNKPTDLIVLNFLKTRSSRRPEPTHIKFCQDTKTLVIASNEDVSTVFQGRKKKAKSEDVKSYLEDNYQEEYLGSDLIEKLMDWFSCSDKTAKNRLQELLDDKLVINSKEGNSMLLTKAKEGKHIVYKMMKANV